jgi:hypothetical protein
MNTKSNDSNALKPFQENRQHPISHDPILEAQIIILHKSGGSDNDN